MQEIWSAKTILEKNKSRLVLPDFKTYRATLITTKHRQRDQWDRAHKETCPFIVDFKQRCQINLAEKGKFVQQMLLKQLDIYIEERKIN